MRWFFPSLLLMWFVLSSGSLEAGFGSWEFVRGDFDGDADVQLDDAISLLDYLFVGGSAPGCLDAIDVNDDGAHGLLDPVYLLTHLFVSGADAPPAPFPSCGVDTTSDGIGCDGPLGGCPSADLPPNISFAFADDGVEESIGIRMHPNAAPVTGLNFDELRYGMRPATISVGSTTGVVTVSASDTNVELFELDGASIALPAVFLASDLPATVLVNATAVGTTTLTADHSANPIDDVVTLNVSRFPGLAGGALTSYPFFEYARSINDDTQVETAIDPTRYGARAGSSYRVYVVEHRTPGEWAANNTLVDVSGGFESATVGGASIGDNVIDAWSAGLDGGDGFGVAYDVVYDFGNDGTLDPGDLIDGLSYNEAGFYLVKDLDDAGPFSTTTINYTGGTWLGQRTYYPSNIATMGELPLVVISHGNGHQYTWYDYLGTHLASHGYVVMSHQNQTGPGITTASTTTLTNTDYLLGNLATIGSGVLDDHVDTSRIAWIGHSRGGEGVVLAYHRLVIGTFTPSNYTDDDVILVSSIAPTMFNDVNTTNPHDVNYHLLYGAADGDVAGGPGNSWPFQVHQAADGFSQATYVQGASHNDFNCCGFNDGTGPSLIGRPSVQVVARSYYLALIELYLSDNPAAKDYFTRNFDHFKPSGIAGNVRVANQYKAHISTPNTIFEDYQTQSSIFTSSSGSAVSFSVTNVFEERMRDTNGSFSWTSTDPMNCMTQAFDAADQSRGVVFDWASGVDAFYEIEIPAGMRDFSDNIFLGFRACQGSRHPYTNTLAGTLDFTVTLRDEGGTTSSINFGEVGSITRPYQRSGSGSGTGWANEFNSIRLRLADFENDASSLDLTRIEAIRFEFGPSFGSSIGRIGLDDVHLTASE